MLLRPCRLWQIVPTVNCPWSLAPPGLVAAGPPPLTRGISEEQYNACPDAVDELFRRSISQKSQEVPTGRLLTTRREAISLYREIWRTSVLFVWRDKTGRPWREAIRTSARKEFEDARYEKDPEILNRLIITGRDAVQRALQSFVAQKKKIEEQDAAEMRQGRPPRSMI